MSTTSFINKLEGKKKFLKNKAKESGESKPRTDSSEQGLTNDPKQINTPTLEKNPSDKESYVATH